MTYPASKQKISQSDTNRDEQNSLHLSSWSFHPQNQVNQIINRFSISTKIYFSYAIALGIMVLGTTVGVVSGDYYLHRADQQRKIIRQERQQLSKLQNTLFNLQLFPKISANFQTPQSFQKAELAATKQITVARQLLKQINSSAANSAIKELKPLLTKHHSTWKNFPSSLELTLHQIESLTFNSNKLKKANQLLAEFAASENSNQMLQFQDELATVIVVAETQEEQAEIALLQAQRLQIPIIIASIGLSLSMTLLLIVYTRQAIARSVQTITDIVEKAIAESNFDLQAPVTTTDELGKLAISLNQLIGYIKTLLEEQKETKLAADAANHAKSQFLTHMSHELRTPLNGILGYAEILQRSQNITKREQRGIEIIHKCGSHLLTLINDILDISQIETNRMQLYPSDFHLPSFLQGIVEICRIQAEQKDIQFIYQPPENLPAGITTDKKRLRQVLINLVSNAIKFTEAGSVKLQVKVRKSQEKTSYIYIYFAVEDTGIGISKQQLNKIFLPFEQLGDYKIPNEGRGLGLTISQKIVEIMGSSISVKSELGKGSIFEFEIECPTADDWTESSIITSTGKIIGYSGSRKTILIVDDRWENRSLIVNLLQTLGFTVIEASNGQEGLEKANQYQPDLIISDTTMPIMDGREMLSQLRQSETMQNTIVIISSASIFDSERHKSLAAGANDFLVKPVKVKELYRMLSKYLQLNWIYEQVENKQQDYSEKSSRLQTMAIPPKTELIKLLEYVKKGQIKGIKQELDKLAAMDERYQEFVKKLDSLVQCFNIQQIRHFLKKNIT
ncbi:ATP-binding protein [Fischerella sp. JS2]|uniref:ATP-binding protein n=1 Tax=Fischerella sp. JS2 TaxID=2597771 RepID=UPI0028EEAEA2|nr:ATP-binding protein [Fischerella sp. JS2]